ncbi:TauD/TfdA family dioxygenase [Bradyrhizobium sp. WSM2254]|uniref:TauD/TfdA dioxygenase family protein n=1 Tax=Bradyrhizobium sp. WSM2254 TaxID=1188263 RepID=UPI000675E9C4|nr:TauD/TfdA family dioxygenase [Bradyrhizobium sp. WSM2254]
MAEAFIPPENIIRRGARLGAEIVNVRLSADSPQDVLCAIHQLVLEHKVIFLRDQKHLDDAAYERLVTVFTERGPQPLGSPPGLLSTVEIDSDDHWSTNISYHVDPGLSVLRPVAIAPGGGDSAWSNMRAAYLDLPQPLRKLADALWAIYRDESAEAMESGATEANTNSPDEGFVQANLEVDHPVVRIHPETGQRILALGNLEGRFAGLHKDTGQKLFHLLKSYITAPENAVRWSWKVGDIAIWDNRAARHYPIDDKQWDPICRDNLARDLSPSVNGRSSGQRGSTPKPQAARAA